MQHVELTIFIEQDKLRDDMTLAELRKLGAVAFEAVFDFEEMAADWHARVEAAERAAFAFNYEEATDDVAI